MPFPTVHGWLLKIATYSTSKYMYTSITSRFVACGKAYGVNFVIALAKEVNLSYIVITDDIQSRFRGWVLTSSGYCGSNERAAGLIIFIY